MAIVSQIALRSEFKIDKLAVLTDFSENSDLASRYAAAIARGHKAALVLAHAYIPPYSAFAAPEAELVYQAFHDLSKDLSARLEEMTKAAYLRDLRCTTLLREGIPKDLLDEIGDVDLIVVETSGSRPAGPIFWAEIALFGRNCAETVQQTAKRKILS